MHHHHPQPSLSNPSTPTSECIANPHARPARTVWPARWWKRGSRSPAVVRIKVRQSSQLFNSLDPSPFWDRDLDGQAAAFIEEEFSDRISADTWRLAVEVQEGSTSSGDLQTALKRHYLRQAHSARLALREHLRVARFALAGGVAVFLISMATRALLRNWHGISPWIEEGLVIVAWLALWRPAEELLYGWVPYYRKRRRYERLAQVHVAVRNSAATGLHSVSPPGLESPSAGARGRSTP